MRPISSRKTHKPLSGWHALNSYSRAVPELDWPDFDDDSLFAILESVCQGKSRLEEIERSDLVPFLQTPADPRTNPRAERERTPVAGVAQRTAGETGIRAWADADPGDPSSRPLRLVGNAASRPGPRSRSAAHTRSEQSARPDHERPQELLDDDLSPGEKRPSPSLSQARLARKPAGSSPSDLKPPITRPTLPNVGSSL